MASDSFQGVKGSESVASLVLHSRAVRQARRISRGGGQRTCGHAPSPHSEFTTGTAHLPDGKEVCWSCSDQWTRDKIEQTPRGLAVPTLYLTKSPTGQVVLSTWSGGTMLHVTQHSTARVGFGGHRTYFRAEDEYGTKFYGTSPGFEMYARVYKARVQ